MQAQALGAAVLEGWALAIELAGALIVALSLVRAIGILRREGPGTARRSVAEGAILGLSFKLAATVLKTLVAATPERVGMLAAILALRIVLKWTFSRERRRPEEG